MLTPTFAPGCGAGVGGAPRTDLITTGDGNSVRFRRYRVEVVEGADAGASVVLERGSLIVGSAPDADLHLEDGAVSRAHARLVPFADGVEVTDLDSKNGTFSAGTRIGRARLRPGAELVVGRTTLRLRPEDTEAALPPSEATRFRHVHGRSRIMREVFALLEAIAAKDTPVRIEGEPGVGKTRIACALHEARFGDRGLSIVSAGVDDLVAPGADTRTLVIEDVERLGATEQKALAEALEHRTWSARIIATTTAELERVGLDRGLVGALSVVRVKVPPLRARASDIPVLITDILEELGHTSVDLGPADLGRMQAYGWPDNVRELRAVIEGAVTMGSAPLSGDPGADAVVGADLPYKHARAQMLEAFEREYVRSLLSRHEGNVSKAARAAGIDRVYLHRLIKKYSL